MTSATDKRRNAGARTSSAIQPRWSFFIRVPLTDEETRLLNLSYEEWGAKFEDGAPPRIGVGHYIDTLGKDVDKMLPDLDLIKDRDEERAVICLNADRDAALEQLTAAVAHYGLPAFQLTGDTPA